MPVNVPTDRKEKRTHHDTASYSCDYGREMLMWTRSVLGLVGLLDMEKDR